MYLKITIGIIAMAALMLVVSPLVANQASAVKNEQPRECSQDTGSPDLGEDCPGKSGEHNPNREQKECSVTAGVNDKPVKGQEKKLCEEED